MKNKSTSPERFASDLSRRLAMRMTRRNPIVDRDQSRAFLAQVEHRIKTSPAFRRREAAAKAARQAAGRVLRQQLADVRAAREAGADRISCASKADILAALSSRREGVRLVIEFAGTSGRWNLPPVHGEDFRRSQAKLRTQLSKTSDRALFQGLAPKAGPAVPAARGWRALFAEFCGDREFCNALQVADDAGASIVFGVNSSLHGYRLPFPYAIEQDIGDGFALVRALYYGPGFAPGKFRVLSLAHGLTATADHKLADDALAEFEKLRARAIEAAGKMAPNDQDQMRAEFLASAADQVQS